MRPLGQEKSAWERKNEANKVNVRWFLTIAIFSYLAYLLATDRAREIGGALSLNWLYIGGLAAAMIALNLLCTIYLFLVKKRDWRMNPLVKYVTMTADLIMTSFLLVPTGGNESKFFVVYFIVIVSNGLRYGMRLSVFGVLVFNACYLGVLIHQFYPGLRISGMENETLKVVGFWVVGLYVGYLARRFELLQGQVEKYQKLVRDLMEQRRDA